MSSDTVFATYALLLLGSIPTVAGLLPTAIVFITVFSVGEPGNPSITDTVLEAKFATYALFDGSTATPLGKNPTGMVEITVFVAPSITETLFEKKFTT